MNSPSPTTKQKYLSNIVDLKKVTINNPSDPTQKVDIFEATITFTDARLLWLSLATPKVTDAKGGDYPKTNINVTLKDNKSNKTAILIGNATIPGASFLQIFGGSLITDKTFIIRADEECTVYYESKLDE